MVYHLQRARTQRMRDASINWPDTLWASYRSVEASLSRALRTLNWSEPKPRDTHHIIDKCCLEVTRRCSNSCRRERIPLRSPQPVPGVENFELGTIRRLVICITSLISVAWGAVSVAKSAKCVTP